MQFATIIISPGDVVWLGEAYAFGVVWSFCLKSLGVLVLGFQRDDEEYKFPFNLRIGKIELPIGLGLTTMVLFLTAIANLFTKQVATKAGITLTIILFALFLISEQINLRKRHSDKKPLEEFNLEHQPEVASNSLHARPGCVLVAVRDYRRMSHLQKVLDKTNLRGNDILVSTSSSSSTVPR